jgi:hypothetical protein
VCVQNNSKCGSMLWQSAVTNRKLLLLRAVQLKKHAISWTNSQMNNDSVLLSIATTTIIDRFCGAAFSVCLQIQERYVTVVRSLACMAKAWIFSFLKAWYWMIPWVSAGK